MVLTFQLLDIHGFSVKKIGNGTVLELVDFSEILNVGLCYILFILHQSFECSLRLAISVLFQIISHSQKVFIQ